MLVSLPTLNTTANAPVNPKVIDALKSPGMKASKMSVLARRETLNTWSFAGKTALCVAYQAAPKIEPKLKAAPKKPNPLAPIYI